jgi:exonuclease VII small subunit
MVSEQPDGSSAPGVPAPPAAMPRPPAGAAHPEAAASPHALAAAHGRVEPDGTVVVRTRHGERVVGSWQAGDADAALAHFGRKYAELETSVALLEQRAQTGRAAPDDVAKAARRLQASLLDAHAVGDLDALEDRLTALLAAVDQTREQRRAERAAAIEAAAVRKAQIVADAEAVAESADFRKGPDQLRTLLEQWKAEPRLPKDRDDELWQRFAAARSGYAKKRKAHLAELGERREAARAVKERLVVEAEGLATSTDWNATSAAMRDLMTRWKAAGPAPKEVDDALWTRFRAAQDAFYAARSAVHAEADAERRANLQAKEALVVEAEAILPVTDAKRARLTLRGVLDRWTAIGHVPREDVRRLDDRLRRVEDAVKQAEESAWRRSNPEARARAESIVRQLEQGIASLQRDRDAAIARGDAKAAAKAEQALAGRQQFLDDARRVLQEYTG